MKVFLDTNIVIDFYDKRPAFFDAAAEVIAMAWRKEIELVVSVTTFINAFYLLRKSYSNKGLTEAMRKLPEMCIVSDITAKMLTSRLNGNHPDFEDAMQISSAVEFGADVILTRDKQHFANSPITIMTPAEFLMEYASN